MTPEQVKTAKEILDFNDEPSYGYAIRNAISKTAMLFTYMPQIERFMELQPLKRVNVEYNAIYLSNATREELRDFLFAFGGEWKKDVEAFYPDKMRYSREEPHPLAFDIDKDKCTLSVRVVPPPPSCKIVEEDVIIPTHTEKRKKIVCDKEEDIVNPSTPSETTP